MAKVAIVVNRDLLSLSLKEAEASQKFPNLNALWSRVADLYNTKKSNTEKAITLSVVYLRVKEWNLPFITKAGKRGRASMTPQQIQAMQSARKSRKPRKEKLKAFKKTFSMIRTKTPKRFLPMVDAIENGSLRAAIKLNCLECVGYEVKEVKLCTSNDCCFFPHRPYQNASDEEMVTETLPEELNDDIGEDE